MFEKILVPLDGSELAEIPLQYAENLAGTLGSEIHLLHVGGESHGQYEHMHELYIKKMAESVEQGVRLYPGSQERHAITVKTVLLKGNAADMILDYAEREDISVINMATHGRSGIGRWVMGSVASKVIRAANCPIALFRAERPLESTTGEPVEVKYLVPLDGSKESESIVPYVEELSSKIGGEVVLLTVVTRATKPVTTPGAPYVAHSFEAASVFTEDEMKRWQEMAEAYMNKVCDRLGSKGIQARCEVRFGSAADEILKMAGEMEPHIVAMATHGRSFLGNATIGSTAEKVLRQGDAPLLLLRA